MKWSANTTIAVAFVCCGVGVLWLWPKSPPPAGASAPLPVTVEEVKGGPKIEITPRKVKASAPKIKRELGLPATIQADESQHVLATGRLTTTDRPYTLSAVLDAETGDAVIHARADPLPWLAPANQTALAIGYVVKDDGAAWRLKARRDLIRSKEVFAYVEGQIDGDAEKSAGVFAEWRF